MKHIELKKADDINGALFAYIDETELRTDFDTGKTTAVAMYFNGPEEMGDKLTEIKLTLGDNYISDTYRLRGELSEDSKIKAALDAAKIIYEDKGIPERYFSAIFMSQRPIVYTDDPNMQNVN